MIVAIIALSILLLFAVSLIIVLRRDMRRISLKAKKIREEGSNNLIRNESGFMSNELIEEMNILLKEARTGKIYYEQKRHEVEQMMTNISHDLRTPLTSALGYIDILKNEDIPWEERVEELWTIERKLIRLNELIDSFFLYSKVISGENKFEKEEVNLIALLEETAGLFYDDYSAKGRDIIMNSKEKRVNILSNRELLIRVFDNLMGNSLKHGEGSLVIDITKCEDEPMVKVEFSNELHDDDVQIDKIFDEFYTTDISRTKGHTGLGLAIAKQFTEILGGKIKASYNDNRFSIILFYSIS
ncbi:HAMP domain-containing sensor histidine kinase [Eubacterium sp.]|uniref:sensor histidine kinase n=1 Tax=Eubacterium sp. TaxID=142586 RepID=UPI00258E497D|nr:HAMP domain-containing sensor histidine kinase [Eubacterium sp.]MCR5369024.1 HAMP domain-containing histidine kinase [Eubacterium sp.]